MKKFVLQVISDIHLEIFRSVKLRPVCPNIALLGDIGYPKTERYHKFLTFCSKNFDHVFLITGNHEYYHHSIREIDDYVSQFSKSFDNITFLQNSSINIDGFRIIGTTLWSNTNPKLAKKSSDYYYIFKDDKVNKIIYKDVLKLHSNAVEYLEEQLSPENTSANIPTIILTHHAPLNYPYATNLDYLMKKPVIGWGYGHTHHNYRFNFMANNHKIKLFTNQMGLKNTKGFYKDYHIILS